MSDKQEKIEAARAEYEKVRKAAWAELWAVFLQTTEPSYREMLDRLDEIDREEDDE